MGRFGLHVALLALGAVSIFGAGPAAAQTTDPALVARIVAAVKAKYPDVSKYCQLDPTERKSIVVGAVMEAAMAAKGKFANPIENGQEAGNQIAKDCGGTEPVTTAGSEMTDPVIIAAIAGKAGDLAFPNDVSTLSSGTPLRMGIFKPDGNGPFPALVLMHQCSALSQDASMLTWAREAVARGYVAFLVDVLTPRNIKTLCSGPEGNVTTERGVKDAFQAADHLRRFAFVDKDRIAVAGFSWGGGVAAMASSKLIADALKTSERRFAAAVSVYPNCLKGLGITRSDIDRPLLLLMGGADVETPPQECVDGFTPAKTAGAPVDWYIYPGMTHCWDCASLDGLKKTDIRGTAVTYRYDAAATKDSTARVFDFLGRTMASTGK